MSVRAFRRMLDRIVVAERDGDVIGYALVHTHAQRRAARLYSIAVDPSARRQGIGLVLMAAAEADTVARGHLALQLEVRDDNASAIRMYERLGYEVFGRIDGFYQDGVAAVRMRRALDQG